MIAFLKRFSLALYLVCAAVAFPAFAAEPMSVLYHEPLIPLSAPADSPARRTDSDDVLVFDAFGRRFEIRLTENRRLSRQLTGAGPEYLRGEVIGEPRAWARLTRRGETLSGMIRDANDVYVIEPRAEILDSLLDPAASETAINVIYRLADTIMSPGGFSCGSVSDMATEGLDTGMVSGRTAYAQMLAELGAEIDPPTAAAFGARRAVTVGVVADYGLSSGLQSLTESQLLDRFNIADGIYSEELELAIVVDAVTVFATPAEEPFSNTTNAGNLLNELRNWRRSSAAQSRLGLTHLVTSRNLLTDDGQNLSGIAYVGAARSAGVCTNSGASLSEYVSSRTYSALVIAHEIGHNLGAIHDGEGICAGQPQTFLMAPVIRFGNDEFSQCSLDSIEPVINAAFCIFELDYADLQLSPPLEAPAGAELRAAFGGLIDLTYTIVNIGGDVATPNTAFFSLPAGISMASLSADDGTCSTAPPVCSIDPLASNQKTTVSATLRASTIGSITIEHTVATADDIDPGNDSQSTDLLIAFSPNLQVSITGASGVALDAPGGATVRILNNSGLAASNVQIDLSASTGLMIDSISSAAAACASGSCMAGAVAGQESLEIDVTFTGNAGGMQALTAAATLNESDADLNDNIASLRVSVVPPSSGGSALNWSCLLFLWLAAARKRQLSRRAGTGMRKDPELRSR